MSDTRQQHTPSDSTATSRPDSDRAEKQTDKHSSKTSGTNRDFDDSGESQNQAHGHPREERTRESKR